MSHNDCSTALCRRCNVRIGTYPYDRLMTPSELTVLASVIRHRRAAAVASYSPKATRRLADGLRSALVRYVRKLRRIDANGSS